jgi:uncharacterized membrane protein YkgB
MLRVTIAVVFLWFGALDFTPGAAEAMVPFVANTLILSWLSRRADLSLAHLPREGALLGPQRTWHGDNGGYALARAMGALKIATGVLVLARLVCSVAGGFGAALAFLIALAGLSSLATTPETWDGRHGFPYLSAAGRMVVTNGVVLAGAFALMVQSARGRCR